MQRLDELEAQSIYILREAYNRIEQIAMLWSLGKDSNALLWLARKAFFGHVPFPVMHVDTGKKFKEMYEFRERYAKEWGLNFLKEDCPPIEETDPELPPAMRAAERKTLGLTRAIEKHGFRGLILGIRRDEEARRAKERVFSPRNENNEWDVREQPPEFWDQYKTDFPPGTHIRVHPLLHWTEIDIWRYIQREEIPLVSLYFAREGKRYRSLGDEDITFPIDSEAATLEEIIHELETTNTSERAGRAMDHEREDGFERLRAQGYM
ncbi:MAG: sulfate adenylyltransferase subunit 2 [Rhodospirillales bacterium]|nr:sulfate adenylyltransferase subunit 2 [Rhodospirillales bacterium]